MPAFIDLTGRIFGRLRIIKRVANKGAKVKWAYVCECGKTGAAMGGDLRSGHQKSCGCLLKDAVATHRASYTPEYKTWVAVKQRCTNPNATHYARYGGRGIKICQRWADSFEAFRADVGPKPSSRHTLERENNDGHYEPGNVRWATRKEQAQNRATNRLIRYNGEVKTVAQWIDVLGLDEDLVRSRLKLGWPFDQIATRSALPQRGGRPRSPINGQFKKVIP